MGIAEIKRGSSICEKRKNAPTIENNEFWTVKFYPYNKPGVDPIYAVVGGRHILICRPPTDKKGIEVVRLIIDEEPDTEHYACCWTKDLAKPLLCVAGLNAKIKIWDVLSGELIRVLVGHGGAINELIISPTDPQILASCSKDTTIRIWSLDRNNEEHPCAAILSGGHRTTILTICNRLVVPHVSIITIFNSSLPLPYLRPQLKIYTDLLVPSVQFHDDSILSRSACEDCIVLWDITGFDSEGRPPSQDEAPTQHEAANGSATLTCFTDPTKNDPYVRLIEFSAPGTETAWIRFSLFQGIPISNQSDSGPDQNLDPDTGLPQISHSILAIPALGSKVYFWDLNRLVAYDEYLRSLPPHFTSKHDPEPQGPFSLSNSGLTSGQQTPNLEEQPQSKMKRPAFLTPFRTRAKRGGAFKSVADRVRDASPASSTTTTTSTSGPSSHSNMNSHPNLNGLKLEGEAEGIVVEKIPTTRMDIKLWNQKYDIRQAYPLKRLQPHKVETVPGWSFMGRGCAWSRGGEWCVVAGGEGVVAVLGRGGVGEK
ncbi:putative wd domain-containing protein [Botrytis cinerea BcDW1]|uniref:Putative wd domain-containing protein n=1 Tax=Botryotinia fuckeliana (strain BcDW1) TaxID=1290391 RepID=M7U3U5_BOTF1|nr:putative wd domain-containing protein [Botrytis cinerea BcDW1]